jgi:hypothetical protein
MTPAQLISAARDGARLAGCTCQPDIAIVPEGGEIYRATIAHDPHCQLVHERRIGDRK